MLFTRKILKDVIHIVNSSISGICKEHRFYCIGERSIYSSLSYNNGLHLLYENKELLVKSFGATNKTYILFKNTSELNDSN